jgi:ribosomal protein L16 Arg81 hydroxylase
METITLKINEKSKAGQVFINFINQFIVNNKSVEIVKEESPYNPEFVKKVINADKNDKRIRINTENIWESIR